MHTRPILKKLIKAPFGRSIDLYQHYHRAFTDGRSPLFICVAEKSSIERYIKQAEFDSIFGGYIRFHNDSTEVIYLGVWGSRKASRLRRLLRERGAIVKVVEGPPSQSRLSSMSQVWSVKGTPGGAA